MIVVVREVVYLPWVTAGKEHGDSEFRWNTDPAGNTAE